MIAAPIQYIVKDETRRPYLEGTGLKVADIAVDTVVWALSPREICDNYPKLSLAQVHAALAYYYDHQAEIDAHIREDVRESSALRAANPNRISRDEFLRRREDSQPTSASP